MSEILQPCPFCGGTNICTEKGINLNYCDSCSAEANIEHWNNRPIEDALRARIAELEAAQRWIPVSERLPEVNEDVFTVVYDTNDGSTSVSALKHHGDGVWFIWDKGYYVVTHWMPMPKLPEAQE